MDMESRSKWVDYSKAKDDMFEGTDTEPSPWYVVDADSKRLARLNCIRHFLNQIEYEDITPEPVALPRGESSRGYTRPPFPHRPWCQTILSERGSS